MLLLPVLGGCTFVATRDDWQSQLVPSGPCYEANLLDGLDTTSTDEAHAVFACLNGSGALTAYAPLDEALDEDTRDGLAGLVLARWIAELPLADLSLRALLDGGIELLRDPSGLFDVLHVGLELVYAQPWPWLGESVPLNSQSALNDGLLVPLLPVAGIAAGTVLDEDLAPLTPLSGALRSDVTRSVVWTAASVGVSTDGTLAELSSSWAADLSDALARTGDGSNDRWSGATGDSLRDLVTALYTYEADGRLTLDHVAGVAEPLLADSRLRDALEVVLRTEVDAGRIDALPAQVLYLTTVDARGGTLTAGEDSALVALLRLLHDANTEVDCTIDLYLFDIDISLGNLSVELLQLLARQDPSTVDGGVSLLGSLLGVSLTDDILDTIAGSGVCPVIDAELVSDLHAVDRLADPQTDELLFVLLDALSAVDDLGAVPTLVDTIGELHAQALVAPVEELLRDTADTALANDLVALLPVLLDPWEYHDAAYFPAGVAPLDYTVAWDTAADLLALDSDGSTPLAALSGPVKAVVAQDATWEGIRRLGALLDEPTALIRDALGAVDTLVQADPALDSFDTLADLVDDHAFVRPLLVLVEANAFRDPLGRTELLQEGPIPFSAKLVHGGTLAIVLDTLELLTTLLPEDD